METKKQEAIRLAYYKEFELSGCDKVIFESRFNNIKQYICENGWFEGNLHNVKMDRFDVSGHEIRPKTLNGIDNNSGWISIESEDDLPKESGSYFTLTNYSNEIIERDYPIFTKSMTIEDENEWWLKNITHYQPIIKPKKPIF